MLEIVRIPAKPLPPLSAHTRTDTHSYVYTHIHTHTYTLESFSSPRTYNTSGNVCERVPGNGTECNGEQDGMERDGSDETGERGVFDWRTKGTKLTAPQVARQGCAILIPTYHFHRVWKLATLVNGHDSGALRKVPRRLSTCDVATIINFNLLSMREELNCETCALYFAKSL